MEMMAVAASVGGTLISALGAHEAGETQKAIATQQANQLRQNANNEQAAAENKVVEDNKKTDYVLSNAQAAAAASGGSATDPTVTTNMKTIAGQGRYNALIDMYQGDAAAQNDNNNAAAIQFGGQQSARAGNIKAFSTILQGGSSLYDKYSTPSTTNLPWQKAGTNLPWQKAGYINPQTGFFY